jgi:hypothetical protein
MCGYKNGSDRIPLGRIAQGVVYLQRNKADRQTIEGYNENELSHQPALCSEGTNCTVVGQR